MSEKMGPLTFGTKDHEIFLGKELTQPTNYSPETAVRIDEEIRRIVMDSYEQAKRLLKENLNSLHLLAQSHLERESLDGDEIQKIVFPQAARFETLDEEPAPSEDATDGEGESDEGSPPSTEEDEKAKPAIPALGLHSQKESG